MPNGQCKNRRDPCTGIPLWVPSRNIPLLVPSRRKGIIGRNSLGRENDPGGGHNHQGGHKAPGRAQGTAPTANRPDGEEINRGNAPHIGQCENRRDRVRASPCGCPLAISPCGCPRAISPCGCPRRRIIKKIGKLFGIITIFHIPPNTILRYIIIIIGIFGYRI